jgi:enoyl-CoA hydratase/3-hydroxyacyl-CoA dehydrogenase
MTGDPDVGYQISDQCAWITMNRPEVRNALSKGMFRDLKKALATASRDEAIRFIAITGAGESFSAGLDIKEVGSFESKSDARAFVYGVVKPFWDQLLSCDKPILSIVDGPAYGAGAEIALASDIVIASTRSKFAFSGGRVGALCSISGVIGPVLMNGRKVVEMNLTGSPLSAQEARSLGLVNQVVTPTKLRPTANKTMQDLRKVSPISNSSFKQIRTAAIPRAALLMAYRQLLSTITSPDFRKGAVAFVAKKSVEF